MAVERVGANDLRQGVWKAGTAMGWGLWMKQSEGGRE